MSKIITVDVKYRGVPIEVEAEYRGGEAAVGGPLEWARPEYAPDAVVIVVKCGGIDIMPLLRSNQIREIELLVVDACNDD